MASSAMCLCHECIVSYFGQYDVRGFVGEWCISSGFAVIGRACGGHVGKNCMDQTEIAYVCMDAVFVSFNIPNGKMLALKHYVHTE